MGEMREWLSPSELIREWSGSEELYDAEEILSAERTFRTVPMSDGNNEEVTALRKAILKKIQLWCNSRVCSHGKGDVISLLKVVERVTDRGHNTLIPDETVVATCMLHKAYAPCAKDTHRPWPDEEWVPLSAAVLNLLSNCTSQLVSSSTADAAAYASMKISLVWHVFELAWDAPIQFPPTAFADGVRVVLSLQSFMPVLDGAVQQRYYQVLTLGVTLSHASVREALPTEAPAESGVQGSEDPLSELFPAGSAARLCRGVLLKHLQSDTFQALYFLRHFLQSHAAQSEGGAAARHPPRSPTQPGVQAKKGVALAKGCLRVLRCFMFPASPQEKSRMVLSTKESLIVLNSVRCAVLLNSGAVMLEVLALVNRLLGDDVAGHIESQWCVVLNIVADVAGFFSSEPSERDLLQEALFESVSRLVDLFPRMDLDTDRARAIRIADSCLGCFGGGAAPAGQIRAIASRVAACKMSDFASASDIGEMMHRHLLHPAGRWAVPDVKKDCLAAFRSKQYQNQTGMLEAGLLSLITAPKDETFSRAAGWTPELAEEVVELVMELLLMANFEGSYISLATWEELVRVCRSIAMHNAEGTAVGSGRRGDVCEALISAASHKLGLTTAAYCPELWKSLLLILFHPDTKIRQRVLAYFRSLHCNEDFEVTLGPVAQGNLQSIAAVAREPLCSLEAEFPVSQVLDTITSRMYIDSECFSDNLKTLRHFLCNNYFMVGNASANAPSVQKLASGMVALVSDEGWQVLSQFGVSAVQEIASTVTCLIPYIHMVPHSAREETCCSILFCITALLRKSLEAWSLFSASNDRTLAGLTELFGAIHVALHQMLTAEELERWPALHEAVGKLLLVLAAVARKALEVAQLLKEGAAPATIPRSNTAPATTMSDVKDTITVHSAQPATASASASGAASPVPGEGSVAASQDMGTPLPNASFSQTLSDVLAETVTTTTTPPPASNNLRSKQFVVSLLSLLQSVVTSCITDDQQPAARAPEAPLHEFSDALFALLGDLTDTSQHEHRVYFLAHMVVAELLHHNRRNMPHPSSRHDFVKRLIFSVKPKQKFPKKPDEKVDEGGNELQRATADLAWRSFYLGSTEMYPQWDPLTEAFFCDGETQCWMTNGPHAPCLISTTTGRSQHMLVAIRSLTASVCWTCILHNKPAVPYVDRPYIPPAQDPSDALQEEPLESVPPCGSGDLLMEHADELRGLTLITSGSFCSLRVGDSGKEGDLDVLCGPDGPELEAEASSTSTTSPHMKEVMDVRRQRVSVSSLAEDEALQLPSHLRDSPAPSYDSPSKTAPAPKFASIASDKRDKGLQQRASGDLLQATWEDLPYLAPPSKGQPSSNDGATQPSPTPRQRITPVPSTCTEIAPLRDVLANSVHSAFILSMFKMTPPPQRLRWDDQLLRTLSALDRIPCKETHKIGLVYIAHDQYSLGDSGLPSAKWSDRELNILSNDGGSVRYQSFMCGLGRFKDLKVPREDPRESVRRGIWPHPCHYFGALDTARQEDGLMCLMSESPMHQVVYHVATIMNSEKKSDMDEERARHYAADKKKRHIGNDHVVVTYCEDDTPGINPFVLKNELNYINILVQPLGVSYSRVSVHFRDCQEDTARSLKELLEETSFGPALCRGSGVVVHDSRLSALVGQAALHASIATKSWRHERQQFSSNWSERLHRIQQLPVRFAVKPENRTQDDGLLDEFHSAHSA